MFICECNKKYKYSQGLSNHKKKCKIRNLLIENQDLKNEILRLQKENDRLLKTQGNTSYITQNFNSGTTTNNNIDNRQIKIDAILNNLQPLDMNSFNKQLDYLNLEDLQTPEKLSKFATETMFRNRLCCTDVIKQICHYKDINGTIKQDKNMKKVTSSFYNSLVKDGYTQYDSPQIHDTNFKQKFVEHTCQASVVHL